MTAPDPDTALDYWTNFVLTHVAERPTLLPHLSVVSLQAARYGYLLGASPREQMLLRVAGLVHDIGKVPALATGFHPLDGADIAARAGAYAVAELVAHHTGARYEAELLGVSIPYQWRPTRLTSALMLADLTTGPNGHVVALNERRQDIERRYAPGSIEVCSLLRLWPEALAAARHLPDDHLMTDDG